MMILDLSRELKKSGFVPVPGNVLDPHRKTSFRPM